MKLIPLLLLLCSTLTASAVGAQDSSRKELPAGWKYVVKSYPDYIPATPPATLSDSAILCQPYFDLAIPDDIKNSVLWMFCDSIKYVVSAGLDSKISTDIVYFTYYGAMTVEYREKLKRFSEAFYNTFGRDGKPVYPVEYVTLDWHTPFAVLWQRKVMWSRE